MGEGGIKTYPSLSIHPSTHPSIHPSSIHIHPSIRSPTYPSIHLSTYLFIHLCIHPPTYSFIHLFIHPLLTHPFIHLSIQLPIHYPSIHPFEHLCICLLIQKTFIESLPHVKGTSLDSSQILPSETALHVTPATPPPPPRPGHSLLSHFPLLFSMAHISVRHTLSFTVAFIMWLSARMAVLGGWEFLFALLTVLSPVPKIVPGTPWVEEFSGKYQEDHWRLPSFPLPP